MRFISCIIFRFDLVDITRQFIVNVAPKFYYAAIESYQEKNLENLRKNSNKFLMMLEDLERILATNKNFLLGVWLQQAKTVPSGGSRNSGMDQIDTLPATSPANGVNSNGAASNGILSTASNGNNSRMINNGNFMPQRGGRIHPLNGGQHQSSSNGGAASPSTTGETSSPSPTKDPNNCFVKAIHKVIYIVKRFIRSCII